MVTGPRTIAELAKWLDEQGVDRKKFLVGSEEADWESYYITPGPPKWSINAKSWPAPATLVLCESEEDVCKCFVELVNGTDSDPASLTVKLNADLRARIDRSWREYEKDAGPIWCPRSELFEESYQRRRQ